MYQIEIHKFNWELIRLSEMPLKNVTILKQLNSHNASNKVNPSIPPILRECPPKTYVQGGHTHNVTPARLTIR
jgi:hypothetical protein